MNEQREALAEMLRPGCFCDSHPSQGTAALCRNWRDREAQRIVAALLASPALARLLADAEQRGAVRGEGGVRDMAERAIRKGYDLDPQEVLDALPKDLVTPTREND